MSNKVHVGIIGTSWWTDVMFLSSFNNHPLAEITSICGRNRERAEEMATKYHIPHVFTDYRELLGKGNLDAVVVATPDDLHYKMTMDALDLDLHILCEKPIALNADHAREMYEKAEANGVKQMVLFTWRWQPHYRYLKQLVEEKYLGTCYYIDLSTMTSFGLGGEYRWRADGSRTNGVISDMGAHLIDFAHWYVGNITSVSAQLATFLEVPGKDGGPITPTNDTATVMLQFENGAQGLIKVSSVAPRGDRWADQNVQLFGDGGALAITQIFFGPDANVTFTGVRRGDEKFGDIEVPESFFKGIDKNELFDPYYKQAAGPRLFIDAILDDAPIEPNFYHGWQVQLVIDSILESSKTGSWVEI
jgi:predicted dehydrogenase